MKARELLKLLMIVLVCCVPAAAQDFEYGTTDELKGLKTVVIDAGPDINAYQPIKKIVETVPGLSVVEDEDQAEIILAITTGKESIMVGRAEHRVNVATGYVSLHAKKRRYRVLMTFDSRQDTLREKSPPEKFAREFVKKYREANGPKTARIT